jgi:hypothetical protein
MRCWIFLFIFNIHNTDCTRVWLVTYPLIATGVVPDYNKIYTYEGVSKIFWTDAIKIIKLTIRPIGRYHPRSSSLPHVDTGPTVSSIFGTLPGSPILPECQALSAIRLSSLLWYQTGVLLVSVLFLEIGSHRVPNQGSTVGRGRQPFSISPETAGWGRKCKTGCCHGEAAGSVPAKVRDNVLARFRAVAAKLRISTRNSQFDLFGPVLRATTPALQMAAPVRYIFGFVTTLPNIWNIQHSPTDFVLS